MVSTHAAWTCILLVLTKPLMTLTEYDSFYFGSFPADFKFGVTTSNYQIEGAWNESGRGEGIWDRFVHQSGHIYNGDTADVAIDSYHRFQQDIDAMKSLGVQVYKFSISWPRIYPEGRGTTPNPAGVMYYSRLIDRLIEAGIEPQVSLFHRDLPQKLQDHGGWLNSTIVQTYCDFAKECFKQFPKVRYWTTISGDAINVAYQGYGTGREAPGVVGTNVYMVVHNMILGHACAYHAYKDAGYTEKIGVAIQSQWYEPLRQSEPDIAATIERAFQFESGWFAEPIFLTGDYPAIMKEKIASKSAVQGVPNRLPVFNDTEKSRIKGSADFLEFNYFASSLVTNSADTTPTPDWANDRDVLLSYNPRWKRRDEPAVYSNPEGLRKLIGYLSRQYKNVDLYIESMGVVDLVDGVRDKTRVEWIKEHTNEALKAIQLDNCTRFKGLSLWTLADNFEWLMGYKHKYGLYAVDTSLKRIPKASSIIYKQIIQDHGFTRGYNGPGGFPSGDIKVKDGIYYDKFPSGFIWSSATAAYQVEGGWKEDVSLISLFCGTSAFNIACDSYHKYKEDVRLIKKLGTSHYRFSISWPRVLPDGTLASVNEDGIAYYDNLINELVKEGIVPMVTLYHWDLPQALEDHGGWMNTTTTDHFKDYAKLCFDRFGDRVKMWITFNEPLVVSYLGYGVGAFAPGRHSPGEGVYRVAHNLILAHAKAYRVYDKTQKGSVGITLNTGWSEPLDPYNPDDLDASERAMNFDFGWFAHPIYVNGDYPDVMKRNVGNKSKKQGLAHSRLPVFSEAEKKLINGTFDFLGLNFYTSSYVTSDIKTSNDPSYDDAKDTKTSTDPDWIGSGSSWLKVTPFGLRKVLNWLKKEYANVPVYVTENGISDNNGTLRDYHRIHFYRTYINEMLKAIKLDGCNVKGYTAWSLMDNFEWARGYSERFGLHYVNFSDPARPRIPKASARWYNQLISDNGFVPGYPNTGGRGTAPDYADQFYYGQFPSDFSWSVATAAYQVEGAWNEGGRGPSIWDTFSHEPNKIRNNDNGDIACDSYHKYKEDVQLIKALKVSHYRFSIAWPRVFPNGTPSSANPAGIQYYHSLIDELLKNGIQPVVTLYHWDLPQALEDQGGWLTRDVADHFRVYADFCFMEYGDKVKLWITLNEPWVIAYLGYGVGMNAPGIVGSGTKSYIAGHNLLRAHAKAYRLYEQTYKATQKGNVAITLNIDWREPEDEFNPDHIAAAERSMQFNLGWFANPIFGSGDYPQVMKDLVGNKSTDAGLNSSRLPEFTPDEITDLKGSFDFFGLNHYTTHVCVDTVYPSNVTEFNADSNAACSQRADWKGSGSFWLKVVPWGIRKLLNWIKSSYGDVPIYITENGVSDVIADLNDTDRVSFYRQYIDEVLKAINLDNVNVTGYTAWSLMDNFEWGAGYSETFGLHYVNFSDPARPRIPKASAAFYRNLVVDNGFLEKGLTSELPMEDEELHGTFPDDFAWATATASYQIEGGVNEGGRGPSNWDTFTHTPGHIRDGSNGDIACDSYHKYGEDINLLRALKVSHYRFSIAWSRIFPTGSGTTPNQAGIDYYNKVIDLLLAANIVPMVTLYHWDTPQTLEDDGGWTNETTADMFADYADVCFREFGDRVQGDTMGMSGISGSD